MIDKIQSNIPPSYANNANSVNSVDGIEGVGGTPGQNNRQVDHRSAQVSLSEDALVLRRSIQAVKDTPDVRPDVVQAIQNQIQAGTYQVNANTLADKLLPFLK